MADFTPQQIEDFLQEFFDVVGTRQYTGARYVPIFGRAGSDTVEWDDTAPYEPLTVVMHLGVSYVSRRYVPAGIQITDTDYWVQTYRFNAQVEQYRQEVLAIQSQIDDLRDDLVPFPVGYPKYGTTGQVLSTLTDGSTRWVDPVSVDATVAEPLIDEWLTDHPEATTTVLDNSVTNAKLVQSGGVLDSLSKTRYSPVMEGGGYIDSTTGQMVTPSSTYHYSRLLQVQGGETYTVTFSASSSVLGLAAYANASVTAADVSKSVAGTGANSQTVIYEVPSGINYLRVCSTGDFANTRFIPYGYGNNMSLGSDASLDFNDVVRPDIYTLTSVNNNAANKPPVTTVVGVLIVNKSHNNLLYQTFVHSYTGLTYTRIKRSTGWDAWAGDVGTQIQTSINPTDLNDIVTPAVYPFTSAQDSVANKPEGSMVGLLLVNARSGLVYQTFVQSYTGTVYTRIKRSGGWDAWSTPDLTPKHRVNVLFVGNSLTQDAIAYLPYVLYNYFKDIQFNIYMWYIGGADLSTQYQAFVNETPADVFSVAEGTAPWTNHAGDTTMASVLSTYHFDMVVMQEYFNYKQTYTETDLSDWNDCQEYIRANYTGNNPLKFVSFLHAPKRSDATTIYERTVAGNELILQKTMAQDIVPAGIAIYRALSTSLNSLGDAGGLSNDGTHAQEGLPCLLQALCVAAWLMDRLGVQKSVYGFPAYMTQQVWNGLNVPGSNLGTGVIRGTDAENVLAQQVAVQAFKEGTYYVNSNLYVPGP